MDIAVLGDGVDGLLAAHAIVSSGHNCVIYTNKDEPVVINGFHSRILTKEIPNVTDRYKPQQLAIRPDAQPPYTIEFLQDFGFGFTKKVFGKDFEDYMNVYQIQEFDDALNTTPLTAFDVKDIYDALHQVYEPYTEHQWLTPQWYKKSSMRHDFDMVFNTLPMPKWCAGGKGGVGHHAFACVYYWTTSKAPYGPLHAGEVYLNSDEDRPHYLQANLWGDKLVEWPEDHRPPIPDVVRVPRPLGHNCDCALRIYDFINIGQFGTWDHTFETHESYYSTISCIELEEKKPQQLDLEL